VPRGQQRIGTDFGELFSAEVATHWDLAAVIARHGKADRCQREPQSDSRQDRLIAE
jgi:hypothetical protein